MHLAFCCPWHLLAAARKGPVAWLCWWQQLLHALAQTHRGQLLFKPATPT